MESQTVTLNEPAMSGEKRSATAFQFLVAVFVKSLFIGVSLVPHPIRISVMAFLFRFAFGIIPRLHRTLHVNLKLAFPQKDERWRKEIIKRNCRELGRLISDSIRLSKLDKGWVENHVSCEALPRYTEVLSQGKGIVIATGHLGSFELLGHAIGLMGHPLAAIARNFKNPILDTWWRGLREARGNRIIDRTGAFKETLHEIERGTSVAILFDQNVTKNHAVFVDLFGVKAATTRSVALAAIKTRATVFVASLRYVGGDKYSIDAVECDFSKIFDDEILSNDEKIHLITQEVSNHFEKMIASFPEGWFWMHRRWKTRPDNDQKRVY